MSPDAGPSLASGDGPLSPNFQELHWLTRTVTDKIHLSAPLGYSGRSHFSILQESAAKRVPIEMLTSRVGR